MAQILDWVAQSYQALSSPLNASRCVNFFPEIEVQDAKSKTPVPVWGCPGISPFAVAGAGPVKALTVMNDALYAVSGQSLYQVNADGSTALLGTWLLQDRVSVDNNGIQIVGVDGYTGWVYQPGGIYQPVAADAPVGQNFVWIYNTGTIANGAAVTVQLTDGSSFTTTCTADTPPPGPAKLPLAAALPFAVPTGANVVAPSVAIGQITDPNFFPARTVTYFDGYFCFDRKGTKEFYLSPLFGIRPLDASLFASKESTSDPILATANSHEQLYLFGEKRIEVWYDAGNAPPTFPFQRSDGALIQRGLGAPYSVVLEDNTLFFLGDDGMFYRLEGFVPERISNHPVETAWQSYGDLSDAFAFIYTLMGHKLLTITFPSAPATWVYDLATRRWHERESWLGASAENSIGRWRVNCAINWNGRILVGDSQSGSIGQLSPNVYTEWFDTMRGLLIGPPIAQDRRRLFMKRFELDVETGMGLTGSVTTVASTGYQPIPVEMASPEVTASADALSGVGATFSTALLSGWFYLPDDDNQHGVKFGDQLGSAGLMIGIFNDQNSSAGHQITVTALDTSASAIVSANYTLTTWSDWIWIAIAIDTTTHTLQLWCNAGLGDQQLSGSVTWLSSNPIANTTGRAWALQPAVGT